MERHVAKQIAMKITNTQLLEMFNNAKSSIKDWTKTSSINKTFTKGFAWNILASNFDVNKEYHILAKINMIREFGEFLPGGLNPAIDKSKKEKITPTHQEPNFENYR